MIETILAVMFIVLVFRVFIIIDVIIKIEQTEQIKSILLKMGKGEDYSEESKKFLSIGDNFYKMLFDFRKWTHKGFFPESERYKK